MTLEAALKRYLSDITPTKKPSTQRGEITKAKKLIEHLGKYSLAALSSEIIAGYRDRRLNEPSRDGNISNNTVRLELALLSHLYTVAIQEWGVGLTFNPVMNIRKPSPGDGRDRRLSSDEAAIGRGCVKTFQSRFDGQKRNENRFPKQILRLADQPNVGRFYLATQTSKRCMRFLHSLTP